MFRVIGIAGLARCGKDTAADYIISKRPAYRKTSFADPIKAMLRVGFEMTDHQLYGTAKDEVDERYGCTPRHMLQTLGTEWGRVNVDPDIWVKAVETHLESIGGTFILPDVRFENEADFVRKHGDMIHVTGRLEAIDSGHVSEAGVGIIGADYHVRNDDDLAAYEHNVYETLRNIEFYWHKAGRG